MEQSHAETPFSHLLYIWAAYHITRIIRSPEISKRLADMGVDPLGGTPEEFGKLIRFETERFGKAVKASGARVD